MYKKKYITPELDIFEFSVEPMLAGTEGGQIGEGDQLSDLGFFDEEKKEDEDLLDEEEDGAAEGFVLPTFHSLWD